MIDSRFCLISFTKRPVCLAAAMLGLVLSAAGCGTSTYKDRLDTALAEAKKQSDFVEHLSDQYVPVFDESVVAELQWRYPTHLFPNRGGEPGESEGETFPEIVMPGHIETLQEAVMDAQLRRKIFYYGYLCRLPAASQADADAQVAKIKDELSRQIKAKFPDADTEWVERELTNPDDGQSKTWQYLSVTGKQPFHDSLSTQSRERDGRFDLYLRGTEYYVYLFGWRCSDGLSGPLKFFPAVEAAVTSAREGAAPEPEETEEEASDKEKPTEKKSAEKATEKDKDKDTDS